MNPRSRSLPFVAAAILIAAMAACTRPTGPPATSPTPASPVAEVSDFDVTEHVRTALNQADSLKGFDIAVETLKGDVRLTGMLDTQAQIDEAMRIARAAEGIHAIHDELTIRK